MTCEKDVGMGLCTFNFVFGYPYTLFACFLALHPYIFLNFLEIFFLDLCLFNSCLQLLQQEIAKPKPRVEVLKKLMARTYSSRREWILDSTSVRTVKDTKEKHLCKCSKYRLFFFNEGLVITLCIYTDAGCPRVWNGCQPDKRS